MKEMYSMFLKMERGEDATEDEEQAANDKNEENTKKDNNQAADPAFQANTN